MAKKKTGTTQRSGSKTKRSTKASAGSRSGRSTKASPSRSRRSSAPSVSGKHLVIVESPTKAKTINRYLGPDYVVMASVGHVRDLPPRAPKGVKQEVPGVDIDNDFEPTYEVLANKKSTVSDLKRAAKQADDVWFATDLDREGEAIAWHLAEALGVPVETAKRVMFNAITKSEIEQAFNRPRNIDTNKVNAQQARRILDRIVGYQVSPFLWKKVAGGLSAGRVQSVSVRVVVEREREIEQFLPEEYWRITGCFATDQGDAPALAEQWRLWLKSSEDGKDRSIREQIAWLSERSCVRADLVEVGGQPFKCDNREQALALATGLGFVLENRHEWSDEKAKGPARELVRFEGAVQAAAPVTIRSMTTKRTTSRPSAPLITSTMQQQAANQLGFHLQRTMRVAQQLYEGVDIHGAEGQTGLITYMRTDSTHLTGEALEMARDYIGSEFGADYLPDKPASYTSSNKSAQEAHEAIRPTDVRITPSRVRRDLSEEQFKLYRLIWERFVACQMTPAKWDSTTVLIETQAGDQPAVFKATGRTLVFDGFYKVTGVPRSGEDAILPPLSEGQPLAPIDVAPTQHFTSPPARYTEASLQKKLEEEGIGRPSTYAPIIQTIQDRKYVQQLAPRDRRLMATDLGKVVTDMLCEAFPRIMDVAYTRDMESELDKVEEEHHDWVTMLREFYGPFRSNLESAHKQMTHAKAVTEPAPHKCAKCGAETVYRFGRNGRFLSCGTYPDCDYAAPIDREGNPMEPLVSDVLCPLCEGPMTRRVGRFGAFLGCANYPQCKGILNLDPKKHTIVLPKTPPLLTDLECPKCGSPLNLRRSKRGPWLSCSTFPKCRGRLGWSTVEEPKQKQLEAALGEHEAAHPRPVIRNTDGMVVGEDYVPKVGDEAPDDGDDSTATIDSDAA